MIRPDLIKKKASPWLIIVLWPSLFVFISAMIFAFITFMTNTHLWGKDTSKNYSINISP